jgi:hypothetical protein
MHSNTKRRDDYTALITRFLDRHRIKTFRFEHRSKHRAVVVEHGGRITTVIFPNSGSDVRGPRNTIATLRHALGLIGGAPQ